MNAKCSPLSAGRQSSRRRLPWCLDRGCFSARQLLPLSKMSPQSNSPQRDASCSNCRLGVNVNSYFSIALNSAQRQRNHALACILIFGGFPNREQESRASPMYPLLFARKRILTNQHRTIAQFAEVHPVLLDPAIQGTWRNSGGLGCHLNRQHPDFGVAHGTPLRHRRLAASGHAEFAPLNRYLYAPSQPHPYLGYLLPVAFSDGRVRPTIWPQPDRSALVST